MKTESCYIYVFKERHKNNKRNWKLNKPQAGYMHVCVFTPKCIEIKLLGTIDKEKVLKQVGK